MKTKMVIFALILGACLVAFVECKSKKSLRQVYEESYQVNLDSCVDVLTKTGYDEASARKLCDCMLEAAFETDSTYVSMSAEAQRLFFETNREKIVGRCAPFDTINSIDFLIPYNRTE